MKVVIILLVVFQNSLAAINTNFSTTVQSQKFKPSTTRLTTSSSSTSQSAHHLTALISLKSYTVSNPQKEITQTTSLHQSTATAFSTTFSPKSTGTIKHFSSSSTTVHTPSTSQSPIPSASVSSDETNTKGSSSTTVPTTPTSDILTGYIKIPGMASLYSALTYMTISDATTCAAECESDDEEDFRCFSFDICSGQKLCSLSPENITNPDLLTDSVGCDHYVRKEPNLKTHKLPDRKVLGKYRRMSGKYNPYSTLTYMSISDVITCAAECESSDEEDFRCYSFDICAGKKLCSLSSENITDSNLLVDSADCDHYSRWYGGSEVTNKIIHIYPTKEPSKNTGTLVGLGVGMLAVGLILGICAICFYNKFKNHKRDGLELDNLRKY
ncbi:hypothetical protein LOTGIDRAFT_235016 [Lottia gigantea]|uniref:Apple domain-containing protein n=1 Tax=Lottia gigantea TaxID=225164 RepID=V4BF63_LOTGI|nr:hypothetical protein LOTGIDRAFT_235016 [Lottia gigantea]ESO87524.1 hypothetical protein LOTGIDRAFT_235016 [Lottia gigantea]